MKETDVQPNPLRDMPPPALAVQRLVLRGARLAAPGVRAALACGMALARRGAAALMRVGDGEFGGFKLISSAFALTFLGVLGILWLVPRTIAPVPPLETATCQSFHVVSAEQSELRVRPITLARKAGIVVAGQRLMVCSEIGPWLGVALDADGGCFDPANPGAKTLAEACATGWIRARDVRGKGD